MSAQAGIFYFDRRPIEPEVIDLLDRYLASRGADGRSSYTTDGLAMVHRASHLNREDRRERQPYTSSAGVVMTWDGRLDNRDDLRLQEGTTGDRLVTDVELAMASYTRWGESGLRRLIGDWSLAIWDSTRRVVVLASDYMGQRPLYYHADRQRVVWSSSLEGLVRLMGCDDDLESRYVAGFLSLGVPAGLTPYRRVLSTPAGHALSIAHDGAIATRSFWNYPINAIRYADEDSYAEHLRHVFRDAVRSRLRVDGAAWAELSGGWDSSAVVCMAHEVMKSSSVQAHSLKTISYVSYASEEANELRFIRAVETHCGLSGCHIPIDDYLYEPVTSWVTPSVPPRLAVHMREIVHAGGGRLLLTGRLGDAVMGSFRDNSAALADQLVSGHILEYLARARMWARATQQPLISLLPKTLRLLLPPSVQRKKAVREAVRRAASDPRIKTDDYERAFVLHPTLAKQVADISSDYQVPPRTWPPSKRELVRNLSDSGWTRRYVDPAALSYVESTHPYTDRRLVEFVLAIPAEVLCRPGEPRSLMRRAFKGFLPPTIVARFSKGHASPSIIRSLRPTLGPWVTDTSDLEVVKRGYVSAEGLANRARLTLAGTMPVSNIVSIVRLEMWLRARAGARDRDLRADSNSPREGGEYHGIREA